MLAERFRERERAADYRAAIVASMVSGYTRKKPLEPGAFFLSLRNGGGGAAAGRAGQTPEQQLAIFRHIVGDRLIQA